MKKIIPFSKYFFPAAVFSTILVVFGIVGYIVFGGFELGVDFRAGLIQEVQFAPKAFSLTYTGRGNAQISLDGNNLYIVISGSGVDPVTHRFAFSEYRTVGAIRYGLSAIDGLSVTAEAADSLNFHRLIQNALEHSDLGAVPYNVHYLPEEAAPIPIDVVRSSLLPLGNVSVQILGQPSDRRFMIRMDDTEIESAGGPVIASGKIAEVLAASGNGPLVVTSSNQVGSRFSKDLTEQAGLLLTLTLLLILAYVSFRFKPQFALGAVIAIIHDGFIVVAFIVWSRMEFTTTSIAAILTILGYSINDTIVIFDRIRETRRIYPEDNFVDVLNRSISETLSRTVITTVTTMLAVLMLFIFTTGSMKDFATALLIGMISGVYSTIFIACGFVNYWDIQIKKREQKRLGIKIAAPVKAKAAAQS
ncbi:MAG: protein translocase subunit SecF [Treponema sp.]|jgi:preprotein translocase subunit SecF|nr:protein translocase subunit SecF [Treponema sp.]